MLTPRPLPPPSAKATRRPDLRVCCTKDRTDRLYADGDGPQSAASEAKPSRRLSFMSTVQPMPTAPTKRSRGQDRHLVPHVACTTQCIAQALVHNTTRPIQTPSETATLLAAFAPAERPCECSPRHTQGLSPDAPYDYTVVVQWWGPSPPHIYIHTLAFTRLWTAHAGYASPRTPTSDGLISTKTK